MRTCKNCGVEKGVDHFEKTTADGKCRRAVCKPCYNKQKADRAREAAATRDPSAIPKPSACIKCGKGPNETDFKFRNDIKQGGWRNECNACYNSKGYCQKYRAKRLEEDPVAFRKQQSESHAAWSERNQDKVKAQQIKTTIDPERKIKMVVNSARARGIEVVTEDREKLMAKLEQPCHYCGIAPSPGGKLNGLDRVDSTQGYLDKNTVPCCATCNSMKGPFTKDVFVSHVRDDICKYKNMCEYKEVESTPYTLPPVFGGRADLRVAEKKEKKDLLTTDEKVHIWSSPCYMCGRTPSMGIDREDASGDYTADNSRPCCSDCNYMKKDLRLDICMGHIARIYAHTKMWVIKDIMDEPLLTFGDCIRNPVALCNKNTGIPVLIFQITDFEAYQVKGDTRYRQECKACRNQRRKASVTMSEPVDKSIIPLPDKCSKCNRALPEVSFSFRQDQKGGSWRTVCVKCRAVNAEGLTHSQAHRKRLLEKDAGAFRARNTLAQKEQRRRHDDDES